MDMSGRREQTMRAVCRLPTLVRQASCGLASDGRTTASKARSRKEFRNRKKKPGAFRPPVELPFERSYEALEPGPVVATEDARVVRVEVAAVDEALRGAVRLRDRLRSLDRNADRHAAVQKLSALARGNRRDRARLRSAHGVVVRERNATATNFRQFH